MDRIPESTVYQTVIVDSFKLYPRVPTLVENQTPEYQNERSTRHEGNRKIVERIENSKKD